MLSRPRYSVPNCTACQFLITSLTPPALPPCALVPSNSGGFTLLSVGDSRRAPRARCSQGGRCRDLVNFPGSCFSPSPGLASRQAKSSGACDGGVWRSAAQRERAGAGTSHTTEHPGQIRRGQSNSLISTAWLHTRSPSVCSLPVYSRQQPACSAGLACACPPPSYNTTLNLQRKLTAEQTAQKPVSLSGSRIFECSLNQKHQMLSAL